MIDELYKEYNAAPDDGETAAISGRFETDEDGLALIYGEGMSPEYGYEALQIQNGRGLGNSRALYTRNTAPDGFSMSYEFAQNLSRRQPALNPDDIPDINITDAEAKRLCDEITVKMGISGMTHYSTYKKYVGGIGAAGPRCCWALQYTRCIDGLPITYTAVRGDAMTEDNTYNQPWPYEILTYYVNDDGIVGLWWEAPYDIGDTVTANSDLLSFTDVMSVF